MLMHIALGQREPKAMALRPARNQRIKHPLAEFLRDTGPVINDMQIQCQPATLFGDCDLARNA